MLAKLSLFILVAACTAAGVLVIRQQRLASMHDMARSVERSAELDRKLWQVRANLAERVTPSRVRGMVDTLGPLQPIPLYWCPPLITEQLKAPQLVGDGSGANPSRGAGTDAKKAKAKSTKTGAKGSTGQRSSSRSQSRDH